MSRPRSITRTQVGSINRSDETNSDQSEISLLKLDLERLKLQLQSQKLNRSEPDKSDQSHPKENLDFKRTSWFVAGVIIASTLNSTTVLVLVLCWIFVENKPLPPFLGGRLPLDILSSIISYLGSFFSRNRKKDPPVTDPVSSVSVQSSPFNLPIIWQVPIPGLMNSTDRVVEES